MSALEMYLSNKGGDIDIAAELRCQIVYLFGSNFAIFYIFLKVYFFLETGGAKAPPPPSAPGSAIRVQSITTKEITANKNWVAKLFVNFRIFQMNFFETYCSVYRAQISFKYSFYRFYLNSFIRESVKSIS